MRKVPPRLLFLSIATVVLHAVTASAQRQIANGSALDLAVLLYYSAAGTLLACYAAVIYTVGALSQRAWVLIIGVPLIVQIGWLLTLPVLAIDAYSYLVDAAHAYAGLSPYQHAVREAAGSELGRVLTSYGWRPVHGVTPYGPVWLDLISIVGPFVSNVEAAVRLVKLIAFAATALTAWLVFRMTPESARVRAFTMFWWNPAVIIEAAGEGHNDAIMVLAVVLSLWCLRRTAVVAAAVALTAAVLTKWIPALFGVSYLIYAWRNGLLTWRTVIAAGSAIVALGVAAYWPLWAGADSFLGIRTIGGPRFVASTTGSLVRVLAEHPTAYSVLRASAASAMAIAMIYAAATTRTMSGLIAACGTIIIVYVLVSPVFWAWYVLLPIALLSLADAVPLTIILTVTSRIVAPLDLIRLRGGLSWTTEVWLTTVIALWLPLAYIVWRTPRSWLHVTIGHSQSAVTATGPSFRQS